MSIRAISRREFLRRLAVAGIAAGAGMRWRQAAATPINSFNASGVQAANCKSLVGVDADGVTVYDFLNVHNGGTGVMTADAGNTSPSSGTYGSGFWITKDTTFINYGYTFSNPFTASAGSGNWCALFVALNEITVAADSNSGPATILCTSTSAYGTLPGIGFLSTVGTGLQPLLVVGATNRLASGTTLSLSANHSLCIISAYGQADPTGFQFYIDGTLVAHGSNYGFGSNGVTIGRIGGVNGENAMTLSLAYAAYFSGTISGGIMSSGNVASLHSSLTGAGAFSLITTGGGPSGPPKSQMMLGRNWRQRKESRIFLPEYREAA